MDKCEFCKSTVELHVNGFDGKNDTYICAKCSNASEVAFQASEMDVDRFESQLSE
jgi:hypothetical protein